MTVAKLCMITVTCLSIVVRPVIQLGNYDDPFTNAHLLMNPELDQLSNNWEVFRRCQQRIIQYRSKLTPTERLNLLPPSLLVQTAPRAPIMVTQQKYTSGATLLHPKTAASDVMTVTPE